MMLQDGQYWRETEEAIEDGKHLLKKKGVEYSQMVVFDIDETSLSNLALYEQSDFHPQRDERHMWYSSSKATVIPAALEFYKDLRERGYSIAFITGRGEKNRASTVDNLESAGYGKECQENPPAAGEMCYDRLVMRASDDDRDAMVYKSDERKKLVDEGFEIVGGVGDQWSDLLGTDRPSTIIKMPNPIYFIP